MIRKKDHFHIRRRIGNTYISLCNLIFTEFRKMMSNDNIRFLVPKPYEIMVFAEGKEDCQYRFKFKNQAIKKYKELIRGELEK